MVFAGLSFEPLRDISRLVSLCLHSVAFLVVVIWALVIVIVCMYSIIVSVIFVLFIMSVSSLLFYFISLMFVVFSFASPCLIS